MKSNNSFLFTFVLLQNAIVIVNAFVPRATSSTPWGVSPKQDNAQQKNDQQQTSSELSSTRNARSVTESSNGNKKKEKNNVKSTRTRSSSSSARSATSSDSAMSATPKRIIIAGAPASGKGTQCEKITATYGVVHLSTGDMLRAAVAAGTDIGKEAKDYMDSGRLVPDSTMIGIVKDRLQQEDCQTRGWLLDGFPRTQAQAQALEEAGICADCFIFLNVPDDVLVERVVGRRTDPVTGKIYHMKFSPPSDEEVIARLQHRSDDTEEKVKVRLEQFHANVEAVKGSYADISVTIDGNQHPTIVTEKIMEAIGSLVTA